MTIGELILKAEKKGFAIYSLSPKPDGEWQARFFKGGVGNIIGNGRDGQAAVEDALKTINPNVYQLELPFA
jgi:hypothetical protein